MGGLVSESVNVKSGGIGGDGTGMGGGGNGLHCTEKNLTVTATQMHRFITSCRTGTRCWQPKLTHDRTNAIGQSRDGQKFRLCSVHACKLTPGFSRG